MAMAMAMPVITGGWGIGFVARLASLVKAKESQGTRSVGVFAHEVALASLQ